MSSSSSLPTEARFSADDNATEIPYRAVSWAAIAALALGCVSFAAFMGPIYWIVPIAGVGLAIGALRYLRANAERFSGQTLAWAGLWLSLLALGWAPARQFQRLAILEGRARQLALDWVDLIQQGDLRQAHQWHVPAAHRAKPDESLKAHYAEDPQREERLKDFFSRPALKNWIDLGAEAKVDLVRMHRSFAYTDSEEFIFEFNVSGRKAGVFREFPLYIVIGRQKQDDGKFELLVTGAVDLDPFLKRS